MPSAMDIATPILDLAGGIATSAFNVSQQRANNRFQRDMSNTSHQREVEDLKKAGLNPILSANHGAATPPTQAPHMENPRIAESVNNSARVSMEKEALANNLAIQNAQKRDINAAAALKEWELDDKKYNQPWFRANRELGYFEFEQEAKQNYESRPALLQEIKERLEALKLQNKHSALGMAHSESESEFYKGIGGDFEHWMKMLGIQIPNVNIFKGRSGKVPRKYRSKTTTDSKGNWKTEDTEEGGRE